MNVSILCSSAEHPIYPLLERWADAHRHEHAIELVTSKRMLSGGDLLLLISCSEIIRPQEREQYRKSLVIHASDLPRGRGWSPHIWQILEGREHLTVTLLEAADPVDSGAIWHQMEVPIPPHFLHDEINAALFKAELQLMDIALTGLDTIQPRAQPIDVAPTWYARRTPEDSRLDPERSLASQFNLLRICDPQRFPAFFELHGQQFKLTVEKIR